MSLTIMLRKNMVFSWTKEGKCSLKLIKEALVAAPTLLNPKISKYFILYAYIKIGNIVSMLVQKNDESFKQSLAFAVKE